MSALITVHEKEWDKLEAEIERLNGLVALQKKDMSVAMDRIAELEAVLKSIVGQTDDQMLDGVWREVNSTAIAALQEVSDE